LTGVFAKPEVALADTLLLYESYEEGGSIPAPTASNYAAFIGSFEVDSPIQLGAGDDTHLGIALKKVGGNVASNNIFLLIASTTDQYASSSEAIWQTNSQTLPNEDAFNFYNIQGNNSGSTWLIPRHSYGIYAYTGNPNGDVISVKADTFGLLYYGYLSWDGDYESTFNENAGLTRIIDIDPAEGETVATSTSFQLSASWYIAEDDYNDDYTLRFRYIRQQDLQASVANIELLYTVIDYPVSSSGFGNYSTTTDISENGKYLYSVELRQSSIINSILSWFSLSNVYDPGLVVRRESDFIAGELTTLDQYIEDMSSTTTALLNDPGVFSDIEDNCNPLSGFSALQCLVALLIPNSNQLQTTINTLKDQVLTKAPVGYITRVVSIMTDTATSTFPLASLSFNSNSPVIPNGSYEVDFVGIMAEAGSILDATHSEGGLIDTAEDESFWDVVMPAVNTVVYLGLFLLVFHDVTGIRRKKQLT